MKIGIYTFADIVTHPVTGGKISTHERLQNLMEEIEIADRVYYYELFSHTCFLKLMDLAALADKIVLHSIELLGTKVATEVRKYTIKKSEV